MTTPVKPWWQRFLDGHSALDDPELPAFVRVLGVRPLGEADGEVRFGWSPPDSTRTPGGWVQGGFIAVALDMAQTVAVFTRIPDGATPMTLEMKVSYIEATLEKDYVVTGRAVRVGRHVAHTDGTITDASGRLVATSTSTHVIR